MNTDRSGELLVNGKYRYILGGYGLRVSSHYIYLPTFMQTWFVRSTGASWTGRTQDRLKWSYNRYLENQANIFFVFVYYLVFPCLRYVYTR